MADIEGHYHQVPADDVDSQPVSRVASGRWFTASLAFAGGCCLVLFAMMVVHGPVSSVDGAAETTSLYGMPAASLRNMKSGMRPAGLCQIPRYQIETKSRAIPMFQAHTPSSPAQCQLNAKFKANRAAQCKRRSHPLQQGRSSIITRAADTAEAGSDAKVGQVVREDLRNIAIIAHVDHGKTTLVDSMLQTAGVVENVGKDDRIMDGNDQEKERGITILAKNAAINYQGTKINIVDTPGHADFGGEVERVLGMVDAALLLVDAQEGPKPQTRFVLKKAIAMGLKILVVVNKVDKPSARPDYVVDKTFDLFCDLGASDEQTDFPIVYASAINRVAGDEPEIDSMTDMEPLFQKILELPKPPANPDGPLQLQIASLASDNFIGRLGIGRITSGKLTKNTEIGLSAGPGTEVKKAKIAQVFTFDALGKVECEEAAAGDIVTFSGISDFKIGDTLVDPNDPQPLTPLEVEQPTMTMTFGVNKSPLAGKSGKFLTIRQIKDRLDKELQTNVAMKYEPVEGNADMVLVSGRGLLHLTVLIESMRREGFEMMIGPPITIERTVDGQREEPFELVDIELPDEYSGAAISLLNDRKGCMSEMGPSNTEGFTSMQYEVPSRGMNGVKSALLTATRGLVIMTTSFSGYKPYAGDFPGRKVGNLVSMAAGAATSYSIESAQARGELFVSPGDEVYDKMIIGQAKQPQDMKINIAKTKTLDNMRAAGNDKNNKIVPAKKFSLEECVEYIVPGEFVEVTPDALRMGVEEHSKR